MKAAGTWAMRGALGLTMAIAMIVPIGRGIFRPYLDQSDPDIGFIYQALQLNDGENRINAEHTGYVYFVILALVLRLARALGFIDLARLSPFQTLSPEAFDAAYTSVIVVGRLLSILLAVLFVLVMFVAGRAASRSALGGLLAAFLTALSWGTASQSLLLRTELLSALFVIVAFTATISAARAPDSRHALWMLVAGLSAALAIATKLQAIVPLLCVAGLAFAFGERPPPEAGSLSPTERKTVAALWLLAALVFGVPAAAMLISGIMMRPGSGAYQVLIASYLLIVLGAFSLAYRVPAIRILAGVSTLVLGFALGVLLHLLYPNPTAVDAIATFVEHMSVYAQGSLPNSPSRDAIVSLAGNTALATLNWHFGGIHIRANSFQLVEFLVIAAIIVNLWLGQRRTAALAALLLATGYVAEAWSRFRGLPPQYLVYTDPWLALAAAVAIGSLAEQWRSRLSLPVIAAAAAILLFVAIRQLNVGLDPHFLAAADATITCEVANGYMPRLAAQFQKFCQ